MSLDPLAAIALRGRSAFAARVRPRLALRELGRNDDGFSQLARRALETALSGNLSADERAWSDRIEQARDALERSPRAVRFADLGAGAPGDAPRSTPATVESTVGSIARQCSKPPRWCLALLRLLTELRPGTCVELGTCVGVSAAYQAAALELCGGGGRLITLEGAEPLAAVARETLGQLGLHSTEVVVGPFEETLPAVLERSAPIDYAFIDGHHDEAATLAYFERFVPHLSGGAVLVFDDIAWSRGMVRAWRRIAADERVAASVSLGPIGVVAV